MSHGKKNNYSVPDYRYDYHYRRVVEFEFKLR